MIPGIARGGLRWHGSGRPTRDCGRVLSLGPRCTRLSWRRCGRRWPSGTGRSRSWRTGSANWTARPGGTRPRRAGPRPRTARTRRPARSRWTGRCGRRPDGSGCGTVTEGQAPPWACGRAQYGPRAHAHAADLVCGNRIPVARAARLMAAMLGLRVGRAGRRGSRQGRRPAGPVHRAGPRPCCAWPRCSTSTRRPPAPKATWPTCTWRAPSSSLTCAPAGGRPPASTLAGCCQRRRDHRPRRLRRLAWGIHPRLTQTAPDQRKNRTHLN